VHMIGPSYDGHEDMIMIVLMILIMRWALSVDVAPGRWDGRQRNRCSSSCKTEILHKL